MHITPLRPLHRCLHFISTGILLAVVSSCQWVNDIFPSDEAPQIISVNIPGISADRIHIDQEKLIITALLPDTLLSLTISPDFTLSKHSELLGKPIIDLRTYCPCAFSSMTKHNSALVLPVDLQQGGKTSHYTLLLKNQAPLRFKQLKAPVEWDYKTNNVIYLPVVNYYGTDYTTGIALTKTGSGTPIGIGGEGCLDACGGHLNEIGVSLSGYMYRDSTGANVSYFKPGLYDLDVYLADGTQAHAAAAVLVK